MAENEAVPTSEIAKLAASLLLYREEEYAEKCGTIWANKEPNDFAFRLFEVAYHNRRSIGQHIFSNAEAEELQALAEQAGLWYTYCAASPDSSAFCGCALGLLRHYKLCANKIWELSDKLTYSDKRWRDVFKYIENSISGYTRYALLVAARMRQEELTVIGKHLDAMFITEGE